MESKHQAEGLRIQRFVFLILFAVLFLLMGRLFKPFLSVIVWSGVAYALVQPLYRRAASLPSGAERPTWIRSLLAGLFALGVLVLIVTPLVLVGIVLVGQVRELSGALAGAIEKGSLLLRGESLAGLSARIAELSGGAIDLSSIDLKSEIAQVAQTLGNSAVSISASVLRNALTLTLTLAFFTFSLYFLLLDGRHLLLLFIDAMPIRNEYTAIFLRKFRDTGRDLVVGYGLVALFQGSMGFLIFLLMGVAGPLPLAILVAITSFIPIFGTGLIWFPISLMRLATGDVFGAVLLFVLCAVLISSLDNVIRPFLLQARIKMHPLLIFFAIVGGLQLFGFDGLILGPLVLVLFFTSVDMFTRAYGRTRRRSGSPEDEAEKEE